MVVLGGVQRDEAVDVLLDVARIELPVDGGDLLLGGGSLRLGDEVGAQEQVEGVGEAHQDVGHADVDVPGGRGVKVGVQPIEFRQGHLRSGLVLRQPGHERAVLCDVGVVAPDIVVPDVALLLMGLPNGLSLDGGQDGGVGLSVGPLQQRRPAISGDHQGGVGDGVGSRGVEPVGTAGEQQQDHGTTMPSTSASIMITAPRPRMRSSTWMVCT